MTKGRQQHSFFTIQDFKFWAESINNNLKGWKIKYYKGLGTSTNKEAKEYFSDILKHQIDFIYIDQEDDNSIDLVFNKKKADDRKNWLQEYESDVNVDHTVKHLRYLDFINMEFIHFSVANNKRAIPHICDGLKPG